MARILNGTMLAALAAGFVGGLLAPVLLPDGARSARPVAKKAIKAGLALYDRGRERLAEFGETASDLVAEVRAEQGGEVGERPFVDREGMDREGALKMAAAQPEAGRDRRYDA